MLKIVGTIIFIISLGIAIPLVNAGQRLFMRIIGVDGMFFNVKKKVIAIIIVWLIIAGFGLKIFGIA